MREARALLTVGAEVLGQLRTAKTVSRLWSDFSSKRATRSSPVTYDWFILALDLLFTMGAIEFSRGRVRRVQP